LGSAITTSFVAGTTYRINKLDAVTNEEGAYVLSVAAVGIRDVAGNAGAGTGSEAGSFKFHRRQVAACFRTVGSNSGMRRTVPVPWR